MIESKHNPLGVITQLLDPYSRQARLYPALIVICPAALLILAWFPALWTTLGVIASLASSFGLSLLLSQVARDRGKRLEPALYESWGGKPSVALLRHHDLRIDEHTKARYREFLGAHLPELRLPTAVEEEADPKAADRAYQSATAWLLTQTRDTKRFAILFKENISFGFRRNLWGLKPIGLVVVLAACIVGTAVIGYRFWAGQIVPAPDVVIVTAGLWVLLIIWVALVTPEWVRIPADAYGAQLLAACDTLSAPAKPHENPKPPAKNSRDRSSQSHL
jgi:hypothetical protein